MFPFKLVGNFIIRDTNGNKASLDVGKVEPYMLMVEICTRVATLEISLQISRNYK